MAEQIPTFASDRSNPGLPAKRNLVEDGVLQVLVAEIEIWLMMHRKVPLEGEGSKV